ncbi:hypothetical protein L218DRAFT_951864 [Marasmius fiardii PR-910]|nr:hypothetical protein L218DRAFT_951864 [Marasmius fiardii PR-910]
MPGDLVKAFKDNGVIVGFHKVIVHNKPPNGLHYLLFEVPHNIFGCGLAIGFMIYIMSQVSNLRDIGNMMNGMEVQMATLVSAAVTKVEVTGPQRSSPKSGEMGGIRD